MATSHSERLENYLSYKIIHKISLTINQTEKKKSWPCLGRFAFIMRNMGHIMATKYLSAHKTVIPEQSIVLFNLHNILAMKWKSVETVERRNSKFIFNGQGYIMFCKIAKLLLEAVFIVFHKDILCTRSSFVLHTQ